MATVPHDVRTDLSTVGEEQKCFSYRVTRTENYEKQAEMKDCKGGLPVFMWPSRIPTSYIYAIQPATCYPTQCSDISRAGAVFEVVHLAA